jgi:hypothetical protein
MDLNCAVVTTYKKMNDCCNTCCSAFGSLVLQSLPSISVLVRSMKLQMSSKEGTFCAKTYRTKEIYTDKRNKG